MPVRHMEKCMGSSTNYNWWS